MKNVFVFCVFCFILHETLQYAQQALGRLKYYNEKYVVNVSIFTHRSSRNAPYLTTFNVTTLAPWGNNITMLSQVKDLKSSTGAITMAIKLCSFFRMEWSRKWIERNTDVPADVCPVPAGSYHLVNMEIPPKNYPIPIISGDYEFRWVTYVTKTKEIVFEIIVQLKILQQKRQCCD